MLTDRCCAKGMRRHFANYFVGRLKFHSTLAMQPCMLITAAHPLRSSRAGGLRNLSSLTEIWRSCLEHLLQV